MKLDTSKKTVRTAVRIIGIALGGLAGFSFMESTITQCDKDRLLANAIQSTINDVEELKKKG